jgi:CheY-like chemotaxis protein
MSEPTPVDPVTPVRVLVVDDDDDVRAALVDELSRRYAVDAVASGTAAFEAVAARTYDVVIADLRMPGPDGIEVLDFVRARQADAIRVLLTGHVDERARDALMRAGAPFRVGKPWHDEIDVVVRHALAERARAPEARRHEPAIDLAALDDDLARAESPHDVAVVAQRHVRGIDGVIACGAVAADRLLCGELGRGGAWNLDLAIDAGTDLRVCARGGDDRSRELATLIVHRARRRAGLLVARGAAGPSARRPSGVRRNELLRRATIGSFTSSLLHDLASSMQSLQAAVDTLEELAEAVVAPDLRDAAADVAAAGHGAITMFLSMRKFLRQGELSTRTVAAAALVDRAVRACGVSRDHVQLRITPSPAPAVDVKVSDALFVQVLVNLIRHTAAASPPGGTVDIAIDAGDDRVAFTVIGDGAVVPAGDEELVLEPLAAADEAGEVALAVSAHIIELHGGTLGYRRLADRGGAFGFSLPIEAKRPRS